MIIEFHDTKERCDIDAFRDWREAHIDSGEEEDIGDGGYFLAFQNKDRAFVHAAVCMHSSSGGMNWSGWLGSGTERSPSLTKTRRVCADSQAELLAWAGEHGIEIDSCEHCMGGSQAFPDATATVLAASTQQDANPRKISAVPDDFQAVEGIAREITITIRSRSEPLRRAALDRARGICEACGTDYSGLAGGLGKRVLQVHHRKQLALADEPVTNSLDDLAVVCANCHLMIHADAANSLSVEGLRKLFAESNEA